MATGSDQTYTVEKTPRVRTIEEIDLHEVRGRPVAKFVTAFLIGTVFFLVPVPYQGEVTSHLIL